MVLEVPEVALLGEGQDGVDIGSQVLRNLRIVLLVELDPCQKTDERQGGRPEDSKGALSAIKHLR